MKLRATYLVILLTVLIIKATAQPVITGKAPSPGFETEAYDGDTVYQGLAGPNVVWDFSGIDIDYIADVKVVTAASTPYATKYGASNFTLKASAGAFNLYNYYHFDANKLEIMGTGIGTIVAENDYTKNYRLWLKFPFNYQDTANDVWMQDTLTYTDSIIYDAYGTLITPFDTFKNVARTKTITKDTAGVVVNIAYTWFSTDSLFQIMSIDSFQTLLIKSVPTPTVGIKAVYNNNSIIKVFPNPASQVITIDAGISGVFTVYDISGRQVMQEMLQAKPKTISLQNMHAGMYYYTITDSSSGQQYTGKLTVNP